MKTMTNFCGGVRKSDLSKLSNAVTMNMFVETKGNDYSANITLRGMPGWNKLYNSTGTPRAIYKSTNGKYFWVAGQQLYCNGTAIKYVGMSDYCKFTETTGNGYVVLVDGYNMWAVNSNASISDMEVKQIELPEVETGVKIKPIDVVNLNGFILVLAQDSDKVYCSVQYPWLEDYSSYHSTEDDIFMLHWKSIEDETKTFGLGMAGYWLYADYSNDKIVGIVVDHGNLIVCGELSIQEFTWGGDRPNFGANVWSSQSANNRSIGVYKNGCIAGPGFYAYFGNNGLYVNGQKVSSDDIDRQVEDEHFSHLSYLKYFSHILVMVYTEKSCIAFDISQNEFVMMCSTFEGIDNIFRYGQCFDRYALRDGAIAEWTENKWDEDDGNRITKSRRSPIIGAEGKRFRVDKVQLNGNQGQFEGEGCFNFYADENLEYHDVYDFSDRGVYALEDQMAFYPKVAGEVFEVEYRTDANAKVGFYDIKIDTKELFR